MQNFKPRAASLCTALILAALSLPALAQGGRMAEAAHQGTYNFLRTAPNHRAHIIEKMPQGTRFEVVGEQSGYCAVILADGTRGWTANVNVRFLQ